MSAVDDYLAGQDPAVRATLEHVLGVARSVVPDAIDGTSYGMPALKFAGRPLIGFVAAKTHLSVYPFSPQVIEQVAGRLEGFRLSKGTIRFSVDRPIPDDVLHDMVAARLEEITGSAG